MKLDLKGPRQAMTGQNQFSPFISWRRAWRADRFGQGRILDAPPKAVAQRAILDKSVSVSPKISAIG
jgi:hypothetical protein